VRIAVLGPGGVGGLLAAALDRAGEEVLVVAQESTAQRIREDGIELDSVMFGQTVVRPRAVSRLSEEVDALLVATKASGLEGSLERIEHDPPLVLPLLNGLDHVELLRRRFPPEAVLAGSIRVEADRPQPGVVVHTSPFLLVSMATRHHQAGGPMQELARAFERAQVPVHVELPISARAEAEVMWGKLVRLCALACTTSAYDKLLGEILSTPELRDDLVGAIEEACEVARADGALAVVPVRALDELERAHVTLGSSMQRDIAAGRTPELDAIPGSVLRAASSHGLTCPTIERLVARIAQRAGLPPPGYRLAPSPARGASAG
jgi:2-dehydropantoate 2-reductase